MMSEIYKNRLFYYQLAKDFLDGKIKAWPFREKFMLQRNADLDKDRVTGYSKYYDNIAWTPCELKFQKEYSWKIYNYTPNDNVSEILNEYVKGAQEYNIRGENFFMDIFNDLSVNIRDFYPRNAESAGYDEEGLAEFSDEEFKKEYLIDEDELRRRVTEKIKILEDNRDRWE